MQKLQIKDPEHVHYVSFSRNFGKEVCAVLWLAGGKLAIMNNCNGC